MLHEGAKALNCGRNCLAYLIKARNIKKLKIPYFMCDCVFDVSKKYGADISFYHIDKHFKPVDIKLANDEWLYVMNYYGQLTRENLVELKQKYDRVIIDNAHAYFDKPIENTDTLYTCRKFFGVADGAFLYTNIELNEELLTDESFERMHFVLGRYERTASEFYAESAANNDLFGSEPIKKMSRLTNNLLHAIDYEYVKNRRTENFKLYHEKLKGINQLELRDVEGTFAYPLLIENGAELRKKLQQQNIYIPTLWPNVVNDMDKDSLEYRFANDILPLPVDQRYGKAEIDFLTMAKTYMRCLG
jgi:hypothetical protein